MSDTPRTDAALVDHMPKDETEWSGSYLALSTHSRKLERELARQYEENVSRIAAQAKAENERDKWREVAEELARHIPFQGHTPHPDEAEALAKFTALKAKDTK